MSAGSVTVWWLSCMAALQRVQSKRCVREARCGRREAPVEEGEHQEDDPHQPQQEPDGGMSHHRGAAGVRQQLVRPSPAAAAAADGGAQDQEERATQRHVRCGVGAEAPCTCDVVATTTPVVVIIGNALAATRCRWRSVAVVLAATCEPVEDSSGGRHDSRLLPWYLKCCAGARRGRSTGAGPAYMGLEDRVVSRGAPLQGEAVQIPFCRDILISVYGVV